MGVDKDVAVCDKHWECQNPNLPIANCNDKVWVDNQNSCKYLKKSICTQVEKYRTRSEPYQKCDQVSWQDCNDVPYEVCDLVTKENCKDVPYNDCQQVPYQDCNPVHKKVSEQVSQKGLSEFAIIQEKNRTDLLTKKLQIMISLN